jgi:hypothetical protein
MERIREHVVYEINLGFLKIRKIDVEVYQEFLRELDVELERAYFPEEEIPTSSVDLARIKHALGVFFDSVTSKVHSLTESDKMLILEDVIQQCSLKHGVVWSQIILMTALQLGHVRAQSIDLYTDEDKTVATSSENYEDERLRAIEQLEKQVKEMTRKNMENDLNTSKEIFSQLDTLHEQGALSYASVTVPIPAKDDAHEEIQEEIPVQTLLRIHQKLQLPENRDNNGLTEWEEIGWVMKESWGKHDAESKSGAVGILQLMEQTAAEVVARRAMGKDVDLTDPKQNLELAYMYYHMKKKEVAQMLGNRGFVIGEGPRSISSKDLKALVFATYNSGTAHVMGMFDKFLQYEHIQETDQFTFKWGHFSQFLASRIHACEETGRFFDTYEYPPEIAAYLRHRKPGTIHVGKIEEMKYYPIYIERLAAELPAALQQFLDNQSRLAFAA